MDVFNKSSYFQRSRDKRYDSGISLDTLSSQSSSTHYNSNESLSYRYAIDPPVIHYDLRQEPNNLINAVQQFQSQKSLSNVNDTTIRTIGETFSQFCQGVPYSGRIKEYRNNCFVQKAIAPPFSASNCGDRYDWRYAEFQNKQEKELRDIKRQLTDFNSCKNTKHYKQTYTEDSLQANHTQINPYSLLVQLEAIEEDENDIEASFDNPPLLISEPNVETYFKAIDLKEGSQCSQAITIRNLNDPVKKNPSLSSKVENEVISKEKELQKLQKKQTEDHFILDEDPVLHPTPTPYLSLPFPYHWFGGTAPSSTEISSTSFRKISNLFRRKLRSAVQKTKGIPCEQIKLQSSKPVDDEVQPRGEDEPKLQKHRIEDHLNLDSRRILNPTLTTYKQKTVAFLEVKTQSIPTNRPIKSHKKLLSISQRDKDGGLRNFENCNNDKQLPVLTQRKPSIFEKLHITEKCIGIVLANGTDPTSTTVENASSTGNPNAGTTEPSTSSATAIVSSEQPIVFNKDRALYTETGKKVMFIDGNRIDMDLLEIQKLNKEATDEVLNSYLTLITRNANMKGAAVHNLSVNFIRRVGERRTEDGLEVVDEDGLVVVDWCETEEELQYIDPNVTEVYIPIHSGDHWFLVHVDIPNRILSVIDSLYYTTARHKMNEELFQRLGKLLRKKYPVSDWDLQFVKNVPVQGVNTNDCGVFLMAHVFNRLNVGNWLRKFPPRDVMEFRKKVFLDFQAEFEKLYTGLEPTVHTYSFPVSISSVDWLKSSIKYPVLTSDVETNICNTWILEEAHDSILQLKTVALLPAFAVKFYGQTLKLPPEWTSLFIKIPKDVLRIYLPLQINERWVIGVVYPIQRKIEIMDTTVRTGNEAKAFGVEIITLARKRFPMGSWQLCIITGLNSSSTKRASTMLSLWFIHNHVKLLYDTIKLTTFGTADFELFKTLVRSKCKFLKSKELSEPVHPGTLSPAVYRTQADPSFHQVTSHKEHTAEAPISPVSSTAAEHCVRCLQILTGDRKFCSLSSPSSKSDKFANAFLESANWLKSTTYSYLLPETGKMCWVCCSTVTTFADFCKGLEANKASITYLLTTSPKGPTRTNCFLCAGYACRKTKMSNQLMTNTGTISFKEIVEKAIGRILQECTPGAILCDSCVRLLESSQSISAGKDKSLDQLQHLVKVSSPVKPKIRKADSATGVTPKLKKSKRRTGQDDPSEVQPEIKVSSETANKSKTLFQSEAPLVNISAADEAEITSFNFDELRNIISKEFEIVINESGWRTKGTIYEEDLDKLDFKEMQKFLLERCPILCTLFKQNQDRTLQIGPKEVTAISILAFSRNRQFNLLQKMLSVELFRKLQERQMQLLGDLGLVTSRTVAYRTADALNRDQELKVLSWKKMEEQRWATALNMEIQEEVQPERTFVRRLESEFENISLQSSSTYMIQIDNIDYMQTSRHQSITKPNVFKHQTVGMLIRHRIPHDVKSLEIEKRATALDTRTYYLSESEKRMLKVEKVQLVKAIACEHIPFLHKPTFKKLNFLNRNVNFSRESMQKTEYVPTGVLEESIGSLKGCIEVLEVLDKFMPQVGSIKLPIRIGGDGLTLALIESAKILRSASHPSETYNHIWGAPMTNLFHKNMIRLERTLQIFALDDRQTRASEGSLANIKEVQGHKNATVRAKESYNFGYELAEDTLRGFTVLLMMKHLHLNDLNSAPSNEMDLDSNAKLEIWLDQAANAAVSEIEAACTIADLEEPFICWICHKSFVDRELIKCSNSNCGKLMHINCVENINQNLTFVRSRESKRKQKVQKEVKAAFCTNSCADTKYKYTMNLLDACIKMKLWRDACRFNDTVMMLLHNKVDLHFFFNYGNTQYFKLCLYLIFSQNMCVPHSIMFDDRYNSTVNLRGKLGSNLEADRTQERVVKESKEAIKAHAGPASAKSVKRRTELVKSIDTLKRVFENVTGTETKGQHYKGRDYTEDTKRFVSRYKSAKLVFKFENRFHGSIRVLDYSTFVTDNSKFHERVANIAKMHDFTKDLANYFDNKLPRRDASTFSKFSYMEQETAWVVGYEAVKNDEYFEAITQEFPKVHVPNDIQYEIAKVISSHSSEDAIAALPCSFGKSLIYVYASLRLFQAERNAENVVITLIISPMISIICDQIRMLNELDLEGIEARENGIEILNNKICQIQRKEIRSQPLFVFATPEFLTSRKGMIDLLSLNPKLLVLDEAHLVAEWGADFRPAFEEIGRCRVYYKGPILALSATLGSCSYYAVRDSLNMTKDPYKAIYSPDRPNVYYAVRDPKYKNKLLGKIVAGLKHYGPNFPKTVIYVDSHTEINSVYTTLMNSLGSAAFVGEGDSFKCNMIHLYYSKQGEKSKAFIHESFVKPNCTLRVLIATVAFGLGVDIPNLKVVIYLQSQRQKQMTPIAQIIQCTGRVARDRLPGVAIIISKQIERDKCFRQTLLDKCKGDDFNWVELNYISDLQTDCLDKCGKACRCIFCTCCDQCRLACVCQNQKPSDYIENFIPTLKDAQDVIEVENVIEVEDLVDDEGVI